MKGLLELLDWIPAGPANGLSAVFQLLIAPSEVAKTEHQQTGDTRGCRRFSQRPIPR